MAVISLSVESASLDRLRARLRRSPAIVREELRAGITRAVRVAQDEVRARTPVRTGRLRANIFGEVHDLPGSVEGRVATRVPYARFVEEGTGPRLIRARSGKVLRFQVGGRVLFRPYVHHPGTRAHHMFRDGMAASRVRVRRLFAGHLGNVTRRIGRGS